MKIRQTAPLGPMRHYTVDGVRYEIGKPIQIDDARGQRIVEAHPKCFDVIEKPTAKKSEG